MFNDLIGPTIGAMRRAADMSEEELGAGVGRSARTIERLEANDRKTPLKRDLEEKIFKVTRTSKVFFGEILSEKLGTHIQRIVRVFPPDAMVSSLDLLKAYKMLTAHEYKLPAEEREQMRSLLDTARNTDFNAESLCREVAKDVIRRINKYREALGEDPSKDPVDWPWRDEKPRWRRS